MVFRTTTPRLLGQRQRRTQDLRRRGKAASKPAIRASTPTKAARRMAGSWASMASMGRFRLTRKWVSYIIQSFY